MREVETEHGMRLLRHKRGNPDPELCRNLPHRATSRLYRRTSEVTQLPTAMELPDAPLGDSVCQGMSRP